MAVFLRRYFATLTVLLVIMSGYGVTMNHLMERVHIEPANEYEYDTNQAVDQWWKEFFPGEAWQSKLPNVIETKQGILLFGEFEQLAPDRLELRPFNHGLATA